MILIDDRGGAKKMTSADHYPTLLSSLIPDSVLTRLESGDVAFSGANGVTVGIELKKVTDAISCLFSGRLADTQLPAMVAAFDVRYLLIEGLYRAEPATGVLQHWRPFKSEKDVKCGRWQDAHAGRNRVMFSAFELWLHTMSEYGQARLERTPDIDGTAALLLALHTWWNRESHASFNVMWSGQEAAALSRPTMQRRIFALLPSIGWERSKAVAERFKTVAEAVAATEKDWAAIDGIGKVIARRAVEALNGTDS